jgi:hypothetical protein
VSRRQVGATRHWHNHLDLFPLAFGGVRFSSAILAGSLSKVGSALLLQRAACVVEDRKEVLPIVIMRAGAVKMNNHFLTGPVSPGILAISRARCGVLAGLICKMSQPRKALFVWL